MAGFMPPRGAVMTLAYFLVVVASGVSCILYQLSRYVGFNNIHMSVLKMLRNPEDIHGGTIDFRVMVQSPTIIPRFLCKAPAQT